MAGKLIFNATEVAQVVAEAKNARSSDRRATLNQLVKGGAYSDDLKLDEARAEEIRESLSAELHLVKDSGVYLLANTWFEGMTIAYAAGCDPKKDRATYYDKSRQIMGGDDCACELSLKAFEDLLAQGVEKIVIYASPRQFTINGIKKKVKKG
jgi:hypothetical protein